MHNKTSVAFVLCNQQAGAYGALASSATQSEPTNRKVNAAYLLSDCTINMLHLYLSVLAVVLFLWILPFPDPAGIPAARNPGVSCICLQLFTVCVGAWVKPWGFTVMSCAAACLAAWAAIYARHIQSVTNVHGSIDSKAFAGVLSDCHK